METILNYEIFTYRDFTMTTFTVVQIISILVFMRVFIYLVGRTFRKYFKARGLDEGRAFVIARFFNYGVYIIAFMLIVHTLGISMSGLLLGSAGLLVGIGFGLQKAFSDFISGIILMVEGDIAVGDKVIVDGQIGMIRSIGVRSSKVMTRDEAEHIIPNSTLVGDNIVNLSMNSPRCRFSVDIGVSYGSDPEEVRSVLLPCADHVNNILPSPPPAVLFSGYGDSSLDFKFLFYTTDYLEIEKIKSDVRYEIFRALKKHSIEIPFPQRDVWIRSADKSSASN